MNRSDRQWWPCRPLSNRKRHVIRNLLTFPRPLRPLWYLRFIMTQTRGTRWREAKARANLWMSLVPCARWPSVFDVITRAFVARVHNVRTVRVVTKIPFCNPMANVNLANFWNDCDCCTKLTPTFRTRWWPFVCWFCCCCFVWCWNDIHICAWLVVDVRPLISFQSNKSRTRIANPNEPIGSNEPTQEYQLSDVDEAWAWKKRGHTLRGIWLRVMFRVSTFSLFICLSFENDRPLHVHRNACPNRQRNQISFWLKHDRKEGKLFRKPNKKLVSLICFLWAHPPVDEWWMNHHQLQRKQIVFSRKQSFSTNL